MRTAIVIPNPNPPTTLAIAGACKLLRLFLEALFHL